VKTSRLAALGLVLALAAPASAQTPETILLEDLTWTELRALVRAGKTTVLLPIGGTEQNGPHMALGKHNARAKALAEQIARVLNNAVVAPVLTYVPEGSVDPPTGHMRFPGTITLREETFRQTLDSAARSFRVHGFRDIVFLGDHGSTQAGERAVAARLNREWAASPVRVHAVEEYYRAATTGFEALLKSRGYRAEEIGQHAGLSDTSLTLAIEPRLVRTTPRVAPAPGEASGVEGDPKRASAELGRLGVELIVTQSVAAIRKSIDISKR
jgi:creatinine amidohydrolase/Fe(II)-dependent formamide hydrolase-like protein